MTPAPPEEVKTDAYKSDIDGAKSIDNSDFEMSSSGRTRTQVGYEDKDYDLDNSEITQSF